MTIGSGAIARQLGVTYVRISQWVGAGLLRPSNLGVGSGGAWRFDEAEVERFRVLLAVRAVIGQGGTWQPLPVVRQVASMLRSGVVRFSAPTHQILVDLDPTLVPGFLDDAPASWVIYTPPGGAPGLPGAASGPPDGPRSIPGGARRRRASRRL